MLLPFANTDWTMYHSNPSQSSNISLHNSALMPKRTWTSTIPPGYSTSPIVDNGIIYIGTGDGNICALSASSGKKIWNYTISTYIVRSSPAIAQDIVYIGSDEALYALDVATGVKIWSYPVYVHSSSPAVVDGVVYFGAGDGMVYALSALDGSEIWNYTTGMTSCATPVVYEGVVYIGGGRTYRGLYALDAVSGEEIWCYTPDWYKNNPWVSAPAIGEGMIFYSTLFRLYGLSLEAGDEVWGSMVRSWASPVVVNGMVFLGSGISGASPPSCYAFDAKTGSQLWNYSAPRGSSFSDPAVGAGVVYFGSSDKSVYGLDVVSGGMVWNYSTDDGVTSIVSGVVLPSPVVGRGEVFVCSADGVLYAIVTGLDVAYFLWVLLPIIVTLTAFLAAVLLFKKYRKVMDNKRHLSPYPR